jgi:hypothetical protein
MVCLDGLGAGLSSEAEASVQRGKKVPEREISGTIIEISPDRMAVQVGREKLVFRVGEMPIGMTSGLTPGDGVRVWYLRESDGHPIAKRLARTTTDGQLAGRLPRARSAKPKKPDPVLDDRAFYGASLDGVRTFAVSGQRREPEREGCP